MESKVLTPLQNIVLTALFENDLGSRGYFLTGGTALAEFYLHHRYSDDLDIFTRKANSLAVDFASFKQNLLSLGLVIAQESIGAEYTRFVVHPDNNRDDKLKIEFARDRAGAAMMAPPKIFDSKIIVDSFEDIAVNKVCTILSRGPEESKDFVDLYFILTESTYRLDYLIGRAREKEAAFDREEGSLNFATRLLGVKNPMIMPRMIKPLTHEALAKYLTPLAEELIRKLAPDR